MSKIDLNDDVIGIFTKLSEGNPGALTALMELSNHSPRIDPQSAFGALSPLLALDMHKIYGSDIYILWSDKCNRDSRKMLMLLRSVQLGFLSERKLQDMAADQMRKVDLSGREWDELDQKVCDTLEEFERPAAEKVKAEVSDD